MKFQTQAHTGVLNKKIAKSKVLGGNKVAATALFTYPENDIGAQEQN